MTEPAEHRYFSERHNLNPNTTGFDLRELCALFGKIFGQMWEERLFDEAFGPINEVFDAGKVGDVSLEILTTIRKKNLWPIHEWQSHYAQHDLFDMIEFLYQHVSAATTSNGYARGTLYDRRAGQAEYRTRINRMLKLYKERYALSREGMVQSVDEGLDSIFDAELRTEDETIREMAQNAAQQFRHHGATVHDRRQAVMTLCGILERMKPTLKGLIASKDESDLFNLANNFQLRHQNAAQKGDYDPLWLNWMYYHCLSVIHVVLRKQDAIERQKSRQAS